MGLVASPIKGDLRRAFDPDNLADSSSATCTAPRRTIQDDSEGADPDVNWNSAHARNAESMPPMQNAEGGVHFWHLRRTLKIKASEHRKRLTARTPLCREKPPRRYNKISLGKAAPAFGPAAAA